VKRLRALEAAALLATFLAGTLVSVARGVTVRLSEPDLSAARSVLLAAMLVLSAAAGAGLSVADITDDPLHNSLDVSENGNANAITFNDDGTKMFITDSLGPAVQSYSLSTAYDITTATQLNRYDISTSGSGRRAGGIAFNSDGTKMFIAEDQNEQIVSYTLSSPYDITNPTKQNTYDVSGQVNGAHGLKFSPDGTKMLVPSGSDGRLVTYTLSDGYDITSASHAHTKDISSREGAPYSTMWNGDGTKLYVGGAENDAVLQYDLTTGYDLSTADHNQTRSVSGQTSEPSGLYLKPGGEKWFLVAMHSEPAVYSYTSDIGGFGVTVSGEITGGDGQAIGGAAVSLNQSGSVVKSTTTSSDGSYSFSGVSSGDYTLEASASGHQSKGTSISVADSPRTVDFKLYESGTFEREFQLGEQAQYTYPPSLSELTIYRFDRALELPLPGGTTFKAGPGTWTEVATRDINAYGKADVRLTDGEPYRVALTATSGGLSTRWESLGWRANKSRADPFLISVTPTTESATATPTPIGTPTSGTATVTPAGPINGGGPLAPPPDPFDRDGDGYHYDYPDTPDTNFTAPDYGDGFGPRLAGECIQADGSEGVLVEFWDPSFETTSLTYNLTSGNQSYAGERQFDTAVGYTTWCVGDGLTGNASDAPGDTTLSGNYTSNGTAFNYTDQLGSDALLGAPIGGGGGAGGGGGSPSTSQTAVGVALIGAVGYLAYRRFGSGASGANDPSAGGGGGSSSSVLPWRGGD
jgi:WD40 repeat protein